MDNTQESRTVNLTRAEQTLLLALTLTTAQHAGKIVEALGYPEVTDAKRVAVLAKVEQVLADVVVGLRDPGPASTPEDLSLVMHEVAVNVVVAILGDPPTGAPPPPKLSLVH